MHTHMISYYSWYSVKRFTDINSLTKYFLTQQTTENKNMLTYLKKNLKLEHSRDKIKRNQLSLSRPEKERTWTALSGNENTQVDNRSDQ